ncbi:hypothetical protein CLTEP_03160 [Clostridium tepidiprofundi DSM 19306]|uniref:YicC family protein n=2 Tax=Clostridium TaxID=1485 RepID=A0A151B7Y7_9CLOT|nr:hypothetical protein CLTEP_03160 [Clostridium tepidiprofundi DSM 19306]
MEDGQCFVVEVKSVNHRYLDINVKMPRTLISLEDKIRKLVSQRISRGKVDIYITQKRFDREDVEACLNEVLADSYYDCLLKIRDRYGVRDDISVSSIARFPEVISIQQKEEDYEKVWSILKKPLEGALELMISMRKCEGEKLCKDISQKCENIKLLIDNIEKRAPKVVEQYSDKLNARLKKILNESQYDESRIAMEIAIFADKASIDEEIVRLNSHIVQLRETLNLSEPVGRKLDFIVQEMNRETNTIASKANDLEIVNAILNVKSEIEKIREQTQNIE